MSNVLLTRPKHDYTMRYISVWNEEVIDIAKSKKFAIFDLEGTRAVRHEVESFLAKKHPELVLLNGHGAPDHVMGNENEVLVQKGENEHTLAGAVVYALSCSSGELLGPACIQSGTKAYIGYDRNFSFIHLTSYRTHPHNDPIAKLFAEPSNLVGTTLLKGHTVGDAYKRSQRAFRRNINRLISSETKPEESATLKYLLWDMQHQVCLGNKEAKIVSDI